MEGMQRKCKNCDNIALSYRNLCRVCYCKYMRVYVDDHASEVRKIKRVSRMRVYYRSRVARIKNMARKAVYRAIKRGLMTRGSCERCNYTFAEAHHESYKKRDWLNVRWLCKDCHRNEHRNLIASYGNAILHTN